MKNLPDDWYESTMRPIREAAKTWPDWMRKGVDEAREHSQRRIAEYHEEERPKRPEDPRS